MLNVPLDDNAPGDGALTSELKDPCDDEFNLTVNKVWKDFIFLSSRPESITVSITRVEVGYEAPDTLLVAGSADGVSGDKVTETVTLTDPDDSSWTSTWQAVRKGLPVAVRKVVGDEVKVVYYRYYVNEVSVENYASKVEIQPGGDGTARITNRYTGPLLPETGGPGVLMLYAVGIFLLIGGGVLLILRLTPDGQKKNRRIKAAGDGNLDLENFSDFLKYLKKKDK